MASPLRRTRKHYDAIDLDANMLSRPKGGVTFAIVLCLPELEMSRVPHFPVLLDQPRPVLTLESKGDPGQGGHHHLVWQSRRPRPRGERPSDGVGEKPSDPGSWKPVGLDSLEYRQVERHRVCNTLFLQAELHID